jgi:hypothetical protein
METALDWPLLWLSIELADFVADLIQVAWKSL